MPDGNFRDYAPPEKIWNLREFTTEIRKLVPGVLEMMSDMLENRKDLTAVEQLALANMVYDRAYGRPRQVAMIADPDGPDQKVRVYIPDNGRVRPLIEAEVAAPGQQDKEPTS